MDHLIEPEIKNHCIHSFFQCKEHKLNYYTRVVNIGLFIAFISSLCLILYFKKKNKLTPEQVRRRNDEDRSYIISKIRSMQMNKHSLLN